MFSLCVVPRGLRELHREIFGFSSTECFFPTETQKKDSDSSLHLMTLDLMVSHVQKIVKVKGWSERCEAINTWVNMALCSMALIPGGVYVVAFKACSVSGSLYFAHQMTDQVVETI